MEEVKACVKCGAKDRYNSGHCRPCRDEIILKWRKANPGKVAAYRLKWRETNPEKVKASRRKWDKANPKKVAEATRRWRKDNPEKVAAIKRRWMENNPDKVSVAEMERLKFYRESSVTNEDLLAVTQRCGGRCVYCGVEVKVCCHHNSLRGFDHIIPIYRGGKHEISNLTVCCWPCNSRKGAMTAIHMERFRLGPTKHNLAKLRKRLHRDMQMLRGSDSMVSQGA